MACLDCQICVVNRCTGKFEINLKENFGEEKNDHVNTPSE